MINSAFLEDKKKDWLKEIISKHNSFCCGICIGNLEERLATEGLMRVGRLSYAVLNPKEDTSSKYLSIMDPILKGKILELIINNLKTADPFDGVNAYDYSHFLYYLERFFSKQYLKQVFDGCYMGLLISAWEKKKVIDGLVLQNKEKKQREARRIKDLLRDWEHIKRIKQKKGRDSNRSKFLNQFKLLTAVEKLELILNEEMEFPYQSIPDESLFEMDLITRYQIQRRFDNQELDILKFKFGATKRKNKRKGWVRMLRGL